MDTYNGTPLPPTEEELIENVKAMLAKEDKVRQNRGKPSISEALDLAYNTSIYKLCASAMGDRFTFTDCLDDEIYDDLFDIKIEYCHDGAYTTSEFNSDGEALTDNAIGIVDEDSFIQEVNDLPVIIRWCGCNEYHIAKAIVNTYSYGCDDLAHNLDRIGYASAWKDSIIKAVKPIFDYAKAGYDHLKEIGFYD